MVTEVTEGIKITIVSDYLSNYSNPSDNYFLYSYQITIENQSEYAVQLLRRQWHIFDSTGEYREVEGAGVVGKQPVIAPGEIYQYESSCNLTSDLGKMWGHYTMERQLDNKRFKVVIPEFQLITPFKMN